MFESELGRLKVPIVADLTGLRHGDRAARRCIVNLERDAKQHGSRLMHNLFPANVAQGIFQGFGQSIFSSLTSVLAAPAKVFWMTIGDSSAAKGVNRKFKSVFAELTDDADAWALKFSDSIGRAALNVKNVLSRFQDTLVPIGFERDDATGISKKLTRLSTDLAASENITQTEAADRIVSGMVGNHEALRRFGVMITETSLKAQLLSMGIEGGSRAATEQQKVIARLNILLKSTRDAQGTAARAAGDYAQETEALSGVITAISASMGDVFTPTLASASKYLREMISDANTGLGDTADLGKRLADSFGLVLERITPMRDEVLQFVDGTWGAVEGLLESMSERINEAGSLSEIWDGFKVDASEAISEIGGELKQVFSGAIAEGMSAGFREVGMDIIKWTVSPGTPSVGSMGRAGAAMIGGSGEPQNPVPDGDASKNEKEPGKADYAGLLGDTAGAARSHALSAAGNLLSDLRETAGAIQEGGLAGGALQIGRNIADSGPSREQNAGSSPSKIWDELPGTLSGLGDSLTEGASKHLTKLLDRKLRAAQQELGSLQQQLESSRTSHRTRGFVGNDRTDYEAVAADLKKQVTSQKREVEHWKAKRKAQGDNAGAAGPYALLESPTAGIISKGTVVLQEYFEDLEGTLKRSRKGWKHSLGKAMRDSKSMIRKAEIERAAREKSQAYNFTSADQLQASIQSALGKTSAEVRRDEERNRTMKIIAEQAEKQVEAIGKVPEKIGETIAKFAGYGA